jgi:hypothetical protein
VRAVGDAFPYRDLLRRFAGIESPVPVILKDGEVEGFDHASLLRRLCELAVENGHLVSVDEAFLILGQSRKLLGEFLFSRLDSEIGLAQGHDRLGRIGVLNDEIAGVPGEVIVLTSLLVAPALTISVVSTKSPEAARPLLWLS